MLNPELRAITNKIRNNELHKKTLNILENLTFEFGGESYTGLSIDEAPAGLSHHHAYPGGYLEHIVSSTSIALALCESVEKVYCGKVNRDLVIAGMLLHDHFKLVSYLTSKKGGYENSLLADRLDHLSLAISELVRRDFPLELIHVVAAHHGNHGPVSPRTLEALICHLADSADSQLNGNMMSAASFLTRKASSEEFLVENAKEAFEIVHSKSLKGWKGVLCAMKRIKRQRETRKT